MKNESSRGIIMSVAFLQADLNFYSNLNILLQQYNRNSLLLFFNYYFYHPQTFDEREKKKRMIQGICDKRTDSVCTFYK